MKYPGTESTQLEFKRELPQNNQIVKTVIGFCNRDGGRLVIGVEDDGSIVGVPDKDIESTLEAIEHSIFDASYPPIIPRLATQRFGDKHIIVIEVSEGMSKPYYRRAEGVKRGTYIRLAKHTARATPDIIQELEWQSRGLEFESMAVYKATKADVDEDAFLEFLKGRKNHGVTSITEETLRGYSMIAFEHTKTYPTTLSILLFGRNPQLFFTEAMIICTHFQGTSGREVIATVDCVGTLFDQFKQAYSFLLSRLNRSFSIDGLRREEKLEIPKIAIREVILNAIIHRNYHIKCPTKIAIYDDRVEIFNPGGFAGPLDTNNLCQGISYLRNPVVCKILREASYIEKLGSGFISIFNSYAEYGLQSPQVVDGDNYVKCILPRGDSKAAVSTGDIEALFLRQEEVTVRDVMRVLKVSRSTALRRINALLDSGVIERTGETRAVTYKKT